MGGRAEGEGEGEEEDKEEVEEEEDKEEEEEEEGEGARAVGTGDPFASHVGWGKASRHCRARSRRECSGEAKLGPKRRESCAPAKAVMGLFLRL
jgi:hypothetical protein